MTGIDFIKVVLCSFGFDRNIKIEIEDTSDITCKLYNIYAATEQGTELSVEDQGLQSTIVSVIKECVSLGYTSPLWIGASLYSMSNDSIREEIIKTEDESKRKIEENRKKYKGLMLWLERNNPCTNCPVNKKDHWDDIHYNCSLSHHSSCKLYWKFVNVRDKYIREINQRDISEDLSKDMTYDYSGELNIYKLGISYKDC